jgi:hypothetical protein
VLVDRIVSIARDLKPDGIQADQVSAADPVLCRRDWHSHAKSSTAFPTGYAEMIPRAIKEARKHVPNFFTFVEGMNDFYGQWFHFNQCALSAEDLRFYRYTLPWHEHIAGIWNEKDTLKNMVVGLRGGHPDLAEPIKAARERFSDYLIYGVYRDCVGLAHGAETFAASYLPADRQSALICAVIDVAAPLEVNLEAIGLTSFGQFRVEISDLEGEVVDTIIVDDPRFCMELPYLEPGVVFARVVPV